MRSPHGEYARTWRTSLPLLPDETAYGTDPKANLRKLIKAGRRSGAFGSVDFDAVSWKDVEIARSCPADGVKHFNLWFTIRSDGSGPKTVAKQVPMNEPFAAFVKSVIRLSDDVKPKSSSQCKLLIRAARELHDVLAHKGFDPTKADTADFIEAESACVRRGENQMWINWVRLGLKGYAEILNTYRISRARISYRPVYAKAVKPDAKTQASYLPSATALRELRKMASSAPSMPPPQRVKYFTTVLMNVAPLRVSDLLSLPEDCEIYEDANGRSMKECDFDRHPEKVRYGLRFVNAKTKNVDVKYIPTKAVKLTRGIIRQIRDLSNEARATARYVDQTGRPQLPEALRARERLTIPELAQVLNLHTVGSRAWLKQEQIDVLSAHVELAGLKLGLMRVSEKRPKDRECAKKLRRQSVKTRGFCVPLAELCRTIANEADHSPQKWLRRHGIDIVPDTVSRAEVEAALLRVHHELPSDFPFKLHECLFVFHRNFFSETRSKPLTCVNELMTAGKVRRFLTGEAKRSSVFEKKGRTELDGSPIHVTTSMFRRYLVTEAMRAGLPSSQASRWLNHENGASLPSYDRRSKEEIVERARAAVNAMQSKSRS